MPLQLPKGTSIEPIGDSILCRMYRFTERIAGSNLVRSVSHAEEVFFAHVEKVGPGRVVDIEFDHTKIPPSKYPQINYMPIFFKPGDDIVFARYHGERMEIGGGMYILMKSDDVLAKVDLSKAKESGLFIFAGESDGEMNKALDSAKDRT